MDLWATSSPATSGVFIAAGNALTICLLPMTVDTQMTLALLQERLIALRVNNADGYKSWLASVLNVNYSIIKGLLNACELCFKYWTADPYLINA